MKEVKIHSKKILGFSYNENSENGSKNSEFSSFKIASKNYNEGFECLIPIKIKGLRSLRTTKVTIENKETYFASENENLEFEDYIFLAEKPQKLTISILGDNESSLLASFDISNSYLFYYKLRLQTPGKIKIKITQKNVTKISIKIFSTHSYLHLEHLKQ